MGIDPTFLLPEVADKEGFFADNGLKVKVVRAENGGAALQLVLSGDADAAVTTEFPGSRALGTGADLAILAQLNDSPDFTALLTRKPISSSDEIRGMKIGVTFNGAGYYFLSRYLESQKISSSEVKLVDIAPPEMIPTLEQGHVDALAVWEPWLTKAEKTVDGSKVFEQSTEDEVYKTPEFLYAGDEMTNDPKIARPMLQSLIDAENWVNQNPDEAAALAADVYKLDDGLAKKLLGIINYRVQLTPSIRTDYADVVDWMTKHKLVKPGIDLDTVFKPAALETIDSNRTK